ncbi:MAG: hypothetical protein LBM39_00945 [Candidatus Methanoplasma sp.]|jgi:hypothetical protein|nr:hypothetical protein [Candidatus Methanoplasma sp.]
MPYRIPDDNTLSDSIEAVMKKHSHIVTQRELTSLVKRELSKEDPEYRASGERIRRLGIERDLLRLVIEYRETDVADLPHVCPVCGNAMSPVTNMSLDGDIVEIKRKCTVCPYAVGKTLLVPGRYHFSPSTGENASDSVKTARKLELAKAKLREAAGIVKKSLENTEFAGRGISAADAILSLAESKDDARSISNLIAEIKALENEDPGWTRPTVSIKNSDRKDI